MKVLAALLMLLPAVLLSDEHQAMCQVGVGDTLPALQLSTPAGQVMSLDQLRGERATVVAVHGVTEAGTLGWMTESLLADLGPDLADPYLSKGVRVVAIGQDRASQTAAGVTALRVSKSESEQQLGPGRRPRIYVLNSVGEIVWLDIEYSVSTRRELLEILEELTADQ